MLHYNIIIKLDFIIERTDKNAAENGSAHEEISNFTQLFL